MQFFRQNISKVLNSYKETSKFLIPPLNSAIVLSLLLLIL